MFIMSVINKKIKQEIIKPNKMGLLVENPVYKPFRYPWCYDAWLTQQRIHWLPEEVPLGDDVRDWQKNLSQSEKNLLTQIFRFFTQADVEVNNCYLRHYTTVFKPTDINKISRVLFNHFLIKNRILAHCNHIVISCQTCLPLLFAEPL